ncbi:hypothetical protein [Acidomonas methanolica]|nr:hypothetical protein [Acidomonas methanolica]
MINNVLTIIVFYLLFSSGEALASAPKNSCIKRLIATKIVNNDGPPAYFAKLNGRKVVGFFDPRAMSTFVWANNGYSLDEYNKASVVGISGISRDAYYTNIPSLDIGNWHIKEVNSVIISEKIDRPHGNPPAILVVGGEIMNGKSMMISQGDSAFFLFDYEGSNCPDEGNLLSSKSVYLKLYGDAEHPENKNMIETKINGKKVYFSINTSEYSTVMTGESFERVFGKDKLHIIHKNSEMVGENSYSGYSYTVNLISMSGLEIKNVPVHVFWGATYNVIGSDILNKFDLIINKDKGSMWLYPRKNNDDLHRPYHLVWWPTQLRVGETHVQE